MEGLGYGCPDNGLIFALNASLWTITMPILALRHRGPEAAIPARPVRRHARRRQRRERARGGLGHLQHADPRRARGDGWVLNGRKTWVTAGRWPTCSSATPRPTRPRACWASRAFLVAARHAGLPRRPRDPQAGHAHGPDGRARLRGLRAPRREPARPRGPRGRGLQLLDGVGARGDPGGHARHDAPAARAVHRARPHAASSSASRSASSSRSPTGSST